MQTIFFAKYRSSLRSWFYNQELWSSQMMCFSDKVCDDITRATPLFHDLLRSRLVCNQTTYIICPCVLYHQPCPSYTSYGATLNMKLLLNLYTLLSSPNTRHTFQFSGALSVLFVSYVDMNCMENEHRAGWFPPFLRGIYSYWIRLAVAKGEGLARQPCLGSLLLCCSGGGEYFLSSIFFWPV